MRTRKASYWDYGISKSEIKELLEKCQNTDSNTERLLLQATQESNYAIAEALFCSLQKGMSFERLDAKMGLHIITKEDFYGYRRKALYLFKEKLMEQDKENIEKLQNDGYIRRYCSVEDAAEEMQLTEKNLREVARSARAIIKIGSIVRINMIALYDYIDRECAVS